MEVEARKSKSKSGNSVSIKSEFNRRRIQILKNKNYVGITKERFAALPNCRTDHHDVFHVDYRFFSSLSASRSFISGTGLFSERFSFAGNFIPIEINIKL